MGIIPLILKKTIMVTELCKKGGQITMQIYNRSKHVWKSNDLVTLLK